jgi:hypothetical protein
VVAKKGNHDAPLLKVDYLIQHAAAVGAAVDVVAEENQRI